jgi:hypothetical protein
MFAKFINKQILSGKGGVRKGAKYVITRDGERLFINEDTVFVDEVIGCSSLHLPISSVSEATNGTFASISSGKELARIGREWMTLTADVKIEECRGPIHWYNEVKAGSKIRLLYSGNPSVAARVMVIYPN